MTVATSPALARIEGQPHAVTVLGRTIEARRVAHAYAFVGPAGSGRTTTALAFAQALLCDRGAGCGACRSCRLAGARQHPDLHVIAPTPPDHNPKGPRAIRIGAIRDLEREASLRPVMASRKVFVLDDADRMTDDSPQAFLKTLEEPPDHTVMVLVLERARAVPATVLSRCQLVRFAARPVGRPPEHAAALDLLGQVAAGGVETLLLRSDRVERERAEAMVDAWWLWGRDLLFAKVGAPASLLENAERASELERQAGSWTMDDILAAIDLLRRAREALAHNVSPRLTIEIILSRLALGAA